MQRLTACLLMFGMASGAEAVLAVGGKRGTVFELEPNPRLEAQLAQAEQVLELLANRGWQVKDLRVRLAQNPYDATQAPADVVLPSSWTLEDQWFWLVRGVVKKNVADSPLADDLADLVAAHWSSPASQLRQRWQARFQETLRGGDIERTALLEVLWRTVGEQGLRHVQTPEDAWRLVGSIGDSKEVLASLWDVTLASLLAPEALGWSKTPAKMPSPPELAGDAVFRTTTPQVRWVRVNPHGDGVAVVPGRLIGCDARLVVLYDDGRFDALELEAGKETRVSFWGVKEVLLGVLTVPGDAYASVFPRELHDYPVRLGAVDFAADGDTWHLSWEVESQEEVDAYVLEEWALDEKGDNVVARHMIPTANTGPAVLAWSSEVQPHTKQVRVYALTRQGVLARLFATPVRDPLAEQPVNQKE